MLRKNSEQPITNSLYQLFQMRKIKEKNGIKLKDLAVQAGVSEPNTRTYFARLYEIGIARLKGKEDHIEVKDIERLRRLQQYLTMREEFIALEKPQPIKEDRISFF